MKTQKILQEVEFLVNPENKEVFAYFPKKNLPDHADRYCYSLSGFDSECSLYYAENCKEATKEQYQNLKAELEGIGYNLVVLNRK